MTTVSIYKMVWSSELGRRAWKMLYGPFATVSAAEASPGYQGPAFHAIYPTGSSPRIDD